MQYWRRIRGFAPLRSPFGSAAIAKGRRRRPGRRLGRMEHEISQSHEYGSYIIHSLETGQPRVIYGNVENKGLIDNLPAGCTVEVPVLVDKSGMQPTRIGSLPPQLAAVIQTNVNVQSLAVEAALTRKREYIYQAAMLDPHTAAELDLDQIKALHKLITLGFALDQVGTRRPPLGLEVRQGNESIAAVVPGAHQTKHLEIHIRGVRGGKTFDGIGQLPPGILHHVGIAEAPGVRLFFDRLHLFNSDKFHLFSIVR